MNLKQLFRLALLLPILGLSACVSSTSLTERWSDETLVGELNLEKVLVLGIFQDQVRRRAFESAFVEQVNKGKHEAVAGYTLMPDETDYDEKVEIEAAVRQVAADAVLITSLTNASKQQRYVPPSVDYIPSMGMGYGYGAYYGAAYQAVYRPGYTVTDTIVQLETRVYSVENGKLIWAGKTQSVNSASSEKITEELVELVTDDMRKSGLIK